MTPAVPAASSGVSGVRRRTRGAIVDAAVATWARDWGAALGDIADAAGVSRSTLHRYFPDRQALVDAAYQQALATLEVGYQEATAGAQTPRQELEALMRTTIDAGDAVILLFADPQRFADRPDWDVEGEGNAEMLELIRRAQQDGAVAPDLAPAWVIGVFYSLVYVAAEAINAGELPRHGAGDVAVRTLFGGIGGSSPATD